MELHLESPNHEANEKNEPRKKPKCLDKISFFIYVSHFLSSFGDRIWQFAVGIFLYYLYPCSLILTAVYGFSTCALLFVLGAPIGRWVDKSKRLKAARISILVQNTAVVLCAAVMTSAIHFKAKIEISWNGHWEFFVYGIIIVLEIVGELASMANKIVLEKDWIVVLARGDERKLSTLNATMRTINLGCNIIAPLVVGNLLEYTSHLTGAIFIASWNVASATAEYYLLHLIFTLVPELSSERPKDNEEPTGSSDLMHQKDVNVSSTAQINMISPVVAEPIVDINTFNQETFGETWQDGGGNLPATVPIVEAQNEGTPPVPVGKCCGIYAFCEGWKLYFTHPVKFAGLGLASLYMTVLSFDYVTIAYLSSQGVSEGLSGNMTGLASIIGILGSLSFPLLRQRVGQNIAGMLGFGMETLCLLFCVAYTIAPGSPFRLASIEMVINGESPLCENNTGNGATSLSVGKLWERHPTIYFLMLGIITARYGLWMADLSVTQIFQENVKESQRGAMGGVQGSLNQLMSLVKFSLTIVLPYPETFGYLIWLSWLFVFFGWLLFAIFVCQDRRARNKVGPESNHAEQGLQKEISHSNSTTNNE